MAASFLRPAVAAVALAGVLALQPARAVAQQAAEASPQEVGFQGFLQLLAARARGAGVREETIQQTIAGLTYNPRVIALDHAQPGGPPDTAAPPFEPYRLAHVDSARIGRGRAIYTQEAARAAGLEARYGVPLQVVLAIWGAETDYGAAQGDFDLARSLATLAYEGRRRELFAGEFVNLLKMIDQGVPRSRLMGSWAGAFGNPQFLPSTFLRLAQDGDGDGVRDIWTNRADTLASIANFFRDAGWRAGQPWGVRAQVPDGLNRAGLATRLAAPVCPRVHARHSRWLSIAEWRVLGVQPQGPIGDDVQASLFEPDGPGKPAYLLTGNYRVILSYNCSNFYALSVGLLADEIAR